MNKHEPDVCPTTARFHSKLVSSDVVPVGGSGQDFGGGARVGARL